MVGGDQMKLLDSLFGKHTASKSSSASTPSTSSDARINQLWEKAKQLGYSDQERKKAAEIYSELLTMVDEQSTIFNVCSILRNRAMAYRSLKNNDAALIDLKRELEIAERQDYYSVRAMQVRDLIAETQDWQHKAQIESSGGEKAARLKAMEEQARGLWRSGSEFDATFDSLFTDLQDPDPDIRAESSRQLAEGREAILKLISIYQESLRSEPRRASLAGRVLGRKAAKGSDEMIDAQIGQLLYGIPVSFLPCSCVHCGHLNKGIAAPPSGPMVAYYHQKDDQGAYAIPVLCDHCGKEFFVVWDQFPG
jgi:tetratricopeptide (TPR) repeat protein